jgi:hypothetical protein
LAIGVTALGGGEGRENFHGGKWVKFKVTQATGARKLASRTRL